MNNPANKRWLTPFPLPDEFSLLFGSNAHNCKECCHHMHLRVSCTTWQTRSVRPHTVFSKLHSSVATAPLIKQLRHSVLCLCFEVLKQGVLFTSMQIREWANNTHVYNQPFALSVNADCTLLHHWQMLVEFWVWLRNTPLVDYHYLLFVHHPTDLPPITWLHLTGNGKSQNTFQKIRCY